MMLAAMLLEPSRLVNVAKLITAYYAERPDPAVPEQRVSFGTSGHRGSALQQAFNEWHILAITQAICRYRAAQGVDGPLFLGIDTHALSEPAAATALEVLAANGVETMIAEGTDYTPTPAVSHAILTYNAGRTTGLADGIVVTPSHNPPADGGFKYNGTNGGPADSGATSWIQNEANRMLEAELDGVRRMPYRAALQAATTHRHDYLTQYVNDLDQVIDFAAIDASLGVDPLGGAGVAYWPRIAERYKLNLTVVNPLVDPTFRFMSLDWDGKIRMDPSSPHVMEPLIALRERFDIAFACDTDHDRHGIVTRSAGLLQPNHYLALCIDYLFTHRPQWGAGTAVGKTAVSSSMIDRVSARLGRRLYEVPVGFKWFVPGLMEGTLGFVGEESAGASFLRRDGRVWTTDKDGIIACLLSAEMTGRWQRDLGEVYAALEEALGRSTYERIEAPANTAQKARLARLAPEDVKASVLGGEPIQQILTRAPGDGNALGGLKVATENAWFAARPSGTEDIYKIYAESFHGQAHLRQVQLEAQAMVADALSA
jgi:phosphoglucomutase